MTRPLRLEFPGALYHVTARGNRRNPIYLTDSDRRAWLDVLTLVCERHHCVIHSFCQMTNHYHLLVETMGANLSQAMRQLNGLYTQYFNWRHSLVGHLFQGRYKAILVQKESYLLELARYIVLNPVRARAVSSLDDWQWSSHHLIVGGDDASPRWLERDWLLSQFGDIRAEARSAYRAFVLAGIDQPSPLAAARHQILLGDDAFVSRHHDLQRSEELVEAVKAERRAVALPLAEYRTRYADRNEAMARAYLSTAFTMPQIAAAFGVSTKTVSRAIAVFESSACALKAEVVSECQT
ncbi:addiction module toxin RelE [Massilia sp. Dwa41.01b]|uniref:transposase n=1 Tax=unclassified Massilia TaxID=2609279 RepID=UPI0016039CA5|nr:MULTISPECIES: transposase [unclassified Massilia]QNA90700.1 addiction module toxin RelE [Massilia sp. Dwa41.01b]QNA97932.1 addiction module toxin RelE [Massilia sp. Se16.2.3]